MLNQWGILIAFIVLSAWLPPQPRGYAAESEAGSPSLLDPAESPPESRGPTTAPAGEDLGSAGSDRELLSRIARDMRSSEQLLRQLERGAATREVQQRIVEELGRLVDQFKQQKGHGAAQQAAAKKASASSAAATQGPPGTAAKPGGLKSDGKEREGSPPPRNLVEEVWGQLPPRLQQQIQSPVHEQFLPQYNQQ
jgi:hypothetical protein